MSGETRITQIIAEAIREGDPDARISHIGAEALREGDPDARLSHIVVEYAYRLEAGGLSIPIAVDKAAIIENISGQMSGCKANVVC